MTLCGSKYSCFYFEIIRQRTLWHRRPRTKRPFCDAEHMTKTGTIPYNDVSDDFWLSRSRRCSPIWAQRYGFDEGSCLVHHDEERRLIAALVARDRSAWSDFVKRFQGLVYARVARTALEFNRHLDRTEIEDICAEIFTALIENDFASLRRFEGRSSLATWLAIIARRSCLKWMQKKNQRQEHANQRIDDPQHDDLAGGGSEDMLAALIQTEDSQRLRTMLGRLNEGDQAVLRMFFLDGLTYAEIGRDLGISINTVGPKLQRAQKRLRHLMETEKQPTTKQNDINPIAINPNAAKNK